MGKEILPPSNGENIGAAPSVFSVRFVTERNGVTPAREWELRFPTRPGYSPDKGAPEQISDDLCVGFGHNLFPEVWTNKGPFMRALHEAMLGHLYSERPSIEELRKLENHTMALGPTDKAVDSITAHLPLDPNQRPYFLVELRIDTGVRNEIQSEGGRLLSKRHIESVPTRLRIFMDRVEGVECAFESGSADDQEAFARQGYNDVPLRTFR